MIRDFKRTGKGTVAAAGGIELDARHFSSTKVADGRASNLCIRRRYENGFVLFVLVSKC